MAKIIRFRARVTLKTVDNLLDEANEVSPYIPRLKSLARNTYGVDSEEYNYVNTYLSALDRYVDHSSRYHETIQDRQADFSLLGNFSEEEIERRIALMQQRLVVFRRRRRLVVAKPLEGDRGA